MQWQPKSNTAPPPAFSISQNQSECGPGCVSLDFAQSTRPIEPASTLFTDFKNLGV